MGKVFLKSYTVSEKSVGSVSDLGLNLKGALVLVSPSKKKKKKKITQEVINLIKEDGMRIAGIFMMVLLLTGCAVGNIKTTVLWHDGKEIVVTSKSTGTVKYTKGDETIEINNQGKANILETIVEVSAIKALSSID